MGACGGWGDGYEWRAGGGYVDCVFFAGMVPRKEV